MTGPRKKRELRSRDWWSAKLRECEESGMSMVAFAKSRGLSLQNLYNWKTVLRRKEKQATSMDKSGASEMQFVEVHIDESEGDCVAEFMSPRGWRLRIPASIDRTAASKLLGLMREQP